MTGVDRRRDDAGARLGKQRRGVGDEGGDADDGNVEREAHRARHRDADADAGERAGAGRHRDAVERGEAALDFSHRFLDHRRQSLGVAARHRPAGAARAARRLSPSTIATETAPQDGVDGEDSH